VYDELAPSHSITSSAVICIDSDGKTERLRGLEVDDVLKLRRLLNRKIRWFLASEDAIEIRSNLSNLRWHVEIVGN